jgi:flagellar protein FliO/FliZ
MTSTLLPIFWFVAIIAMIPLCLWLLKRTPMGGAGGSGLMRTVAVLPLAPNQRLITVEVGQGEDRRWLVLGVTPQNITALHTMAPQGDAPAAPTVPLQAPFAQLLARFKPADASKPKAGEHGAP